MSGYESDDSNVSAGRDLADGIPELQEYWLFINVLLANNSTHPDCAYRTGIQAGTAQPASLGRLNQHPTRYCRLHHPTFIAKAWGCCIHRGLLNNVWQCYWCERERAEQQYYWPTRLSDCEDSPGKDAL
jgi:hypothetical protein